jgi:hypothetical protein
MEMDRPERKRHSPARVKARLRLRARAVSRLALACAAVATCSAAFAAPAAWSATPGAVAGLVREAVTEAPIAKIEVCARATAEPLAPKACATTAATGVYEIAGLPEGQYQVSFSAPAKSGLNYLTQYFDARSAEALADPVTVTEATTTQNVNATMQPGGEVKGLVKDDKGNLLAGIEVCALEKGVDAPARCVSTKASGKYAIAGLASGEYEIEFSSPAGFEPSYVMQFYEAVSSRTAAKPVAVTAGAAAVEGVNAVLEASGAIAGTVSSATTSAALENVHVCALSIAGSRETCTMSEVTGAYTLPGLAPGDYHVEFVSPEGSEAYELQWYKEKRAEAEAEAVTVTAGATTGAIDAKLQPVEAEPTMSAPVSLTKPSIAGTTQQGQTLLFTSGTWLYEPTLVTDEWGRCASSGAIETCFTIAESPTYTLTAEDVGSTIRIREKAFNAFGEGQAFSRPSAVVTGLPASLPAPGVSSSVPPAAGSGVSPAIARAASAAQLKALLTKLLVPRGTAAKLAALHARGSYTATFASLAAGRISIAWYLVPKGARLAKAKPKPVLVASGKLTTRDGGTAKLTIKLTASGRTLLAKRKSLKLTARGAFAPKGLPTLNVTRSFTLTR